MYIRSIRNKRDVKFGVLRNVLEKTAEPMQKKNQPENKRIGRVLGKQVEDVVRGKR